MLHYVHPVVSLFTVSNYAVMWDSGRFPCQQLPLGPRVIVGSLMLDVCSLVSVILSLQAVVCT